mgnify:CR=1 FL=1
MARSKASDYKKQLEELTLKLETVKARIDLRLLTLCKEHPDVIVGHLNDTDIKASSIANPNYISRMSTEDCIDIIDKIEKYLEAQHPHKQTTIEGFN